MKKTYYLFNPGELSRKDNTLKFTPLDEEDRPGMPKYIPIEGIEALYVFGSLRANSALFNFLGKNHVTVHFFDYYEHYTGSFMPKEYLLAGRVQVAQTQHYLRKVHRFELARRFVEGSAANMLRNLKYYQNREKNVGEQAQQIERWMADVQALPTEVGIDGLMGLEGNIRQVYYSGFDEILTDFRMENRTKQPPANEVNAVVSFGNMLCYTACLGAIYHTQLNPTISFLHQPGERRYSLALDLAEVFKPILVDKMLFALFNKKQLQAHHFEWQGNACLLKEKGRRVVLEQWDAKLNETFKHRSLGRNVSYKHLLRLECYKLVKHLLRITPYQPFKAYW